MGVPTGHPFFGNQYSDGGYIAGTFKYVPEIIDKVFERSSKLASDILSKGMSPAVAMQKPSNLSLNGLKIKGTNKNVLIVAAVALAAVVGGYFTYRHFSKKAKAKQEAHQTIELSNVGTCSHCGKPLSGSTYVPESETNDNKAFILCNECGDKNYARYPDDTCSSDNDTKKDNK
jgi:hypothetical protein